MYRLILMVKFMETHVECPFCLMGLNHSSMGVLFEEDERNLPGVTATKRNEMKSGFPSYGGIRFDRITIYFLGRTIPWINSETVDLNTGSDSE